MIPEFDRLSAAQIELMFKAPILACILIAGADGNIDRKEIRSVIEFTRKNQDKNKSSLMEFYRNAGEDFEDKLKIVLQSYPSAAIQRTKLIDAELVQLNAILPLLDKKFALDFYNSLKEIAIRIAKSSGGLLGLNKVGGEEARYIDLPMIKDPSK